MVSLPSGNEKILDNGTASWTFCTMIFIRLPRIWTMPSLSCEKGLVKLCTIYATSPGSECAGGKKGCVADCNATIGGKGMGMCVAGALLIEVLRKAYCPE